MRLLFFLLAIALASTHSMAEAEGDKKLFKENALGKLLDYDSYFTKEEMEDQASFRKWVAERKKYFAQLRERADKEDSQIHLVIGRGNKEMPMPEKEGVLWVYNNTAGETIDRHSEVPYIYGDLGRRGAFVYHGKFLFDRIIVDWSTLKFFGRSHMQAIIDQSLKAGGSFMADIDKALSMYPVTSPDASPFVNADSSPKFNGPELAYFAVSYSEDNELKVSIFGPKGTIGTEDNKLLESLGILDEMPEGEKILAFGVHSSAQTSSPYDSIVINMANIEKYHPLVGKDFEEVKAEVLSLLYKAGAAHLFAPLFEDCRFERGPYPEEGVVHTSVAGDDKDSLYIVCNGKK